MLDNNTINIVVLTYNNFTDLNDTVHSIPAYYKKSIFIVNGGACEKTRAIVGKDFSGISEKDYGISDAFSKGARKSSGKYVHFLNSGDKIYDQSFYKKAIEIFDTDPSVDYIYSNILYKHHSFGDLVITPNHKALKNIAYGMPFPHPGLIVKREIFDRIGYFSDQFKIGMDYDFVLRMMKENYKGVHLDLISVEMEGTGISSRRPFSATIENLKSLRLNNSLGLREGLIISYRLARSATAAFCARTGLGPMMARFHQKKKGI